jgi:hypothetical protein
MTAKPPDSAEERERASFVALVLLLREIAHGLLAEKRAAEARGLIDGLNALKAKTRGNLSPEEGRFLDDVLYDLHLAAVKAPAGPEGSAETDGPSAADADSAPDPEPGGAA